jgi:hypothetical protein
MRIACMMFPGDHPESMLVRTQARAMFDDRETFTD